MDSHFAHRMLVLLNKLNGIRIEAALKRGCLPFYVQNKQVGLIRDDFWPHLKPFSDTFLHIDSSSTTNSLKVGVHLHPDLITYEEKSNAINKVLADLREKDAIHALRGWRHENYAISQKYNEKPLLEVERAGTGVFGIIGYGVHVNGYTKDKDGNVMMWLGRRSKTKPTFPDMHDNMCAGGLPVGMGIKECVIKECQEEGSVSDEILKKLVFSGTVSYYYEDERGLFPECQFIYDLELPHDFTPVNADGEVGSFQKVTIDELKSLMAGDNFKPNCAAVCLDFLIRHGMVDPDKDPNCCTYLEQMHAPLQSYYDDN